MIPQANPGAAYRAHKNEIDEAIHRVCESGRYILGPEVEAFEAEFAAYLGAKHCVGVANGTDALRLAILSAVPQPTRIGVTISMSATATCAAVVEARKTPFFVDILADDYTLDPSALDLALEHAGAFIVPVHLYGQPVHMTDILSRARAHNAVVIEDCAQAHGAWYHGRRVGTFGDDADNARRTQIAQMYDTEQLAHDLLCLPIYPELSDSEVEMASQAVKEAVQAAE